MSNTDTYATYHESKQLRNAIAKEVAKYVIINERTVLALRRMMQATAEYQEAIAATVEETIGIK